MHGAVGIYASEIANTSSMLYMGHMIWSCLGKRKTKLWKPMRKEIKVLEFKSIANRNEVSLFYFNKYSIIDKI